MIEIGWHSINYCKNKSAVFWDTVYMLATVAGWPSKPWLQQLMYISTPPAQRIIVLLWLCHIHPFQMDVYPVEPKVRWGTPVDSRSRSADLLVSRAVAALTNWLSTAAYCGCCRHHRSSLPTSCQTPTSTVSMLTTRTQWYGLDTE